MRPSRKACSSKAGCTNRRAVLELGHLSVKAVLDTPYELTTGNLTGRNCTIIDIAGTSTLRADHCAVECSCDPEREPRAGCGEVLTGWCSWSCVRCGRLSTSQRMACSLLRHGGCISASQRAPRPSRAWRSASGSNCWYATMPEYR